MRYHEIPSIERVLNFSDELSDACRAADGVAARQRAA